MVGGIDLSEAKKEITLGKRVLSTRLVIPPMATNKANADGTVTKENLDFYEDLTQNPHFSLVILEHAFIEERGKCTSNQFSIADDSKVESLSKLAQVIHKNNKVVIAQINHAGAKGFSMETNVSPSVIDDEVATFCRVKYFKSQHALAKAEIQDVVKKYTQAAIRAKKAGFDGIELHSAHGFLLNQFYSKYTNQRSDEYGGAVENRIRIHLEIVKSIREKLGNDFIVAVRLGAVDFLEGGNTIEDAIKASWLLEQAGIDILDVSGGLTGYTRVGREEAGYFSDITEELKKHLTLPVILTGGIQTLSEAQRFLDNKQADFIGIGRALLKDHKWTGRENI